MDRRSSVARPRRVDAEAGAVSAFRDHFSGIAAAYREFRPAYPPELAAWLAAQTPRRELAWDAGCGSGQFSGVLAGAFARVIATDASALQIEQAPRLAGVEFRCARAEQSGLPAGCADLVAAAQAAHWFDLPAFYAEARRVARPGALIALICYGANRIDPAVDPLVERYAQEIAGPYWPAERALVDAHYRTLTFPFEEVVAPPFALTADWDLERFAAYLSTWSATQRMIAQRGVEPYAEFCRELARAWGDPLRKRAIRWPLGLRAGRIA